MKTCDLHTHSTFSDGKRTPTQIIDMAIKIGLSAVALCDHNTVEGLREFTSAAEGKNIEAVPGAEFSVDYNGTELHLLGLYIPERYYSEITDMMSQVVKRKEESNIALVESLRRAGYDISYEDIKRRKADGTVNRVQIGEELTAKGYCQSVSDAFNTLLDEKAGHYAPPRRLTVWTMLDYLVSISAVPVLAHPLKNLDEESLSEFLQKAVRKGLAGMECYYSEYDEKQTEAAMRLARRYGLKFSGGSDYHAETKPHIQLGRGTGNLYVPYEWAVELKP